MTSHLSDEQLSSYADHEESMNTQQLTAKQRATLARYQLIKASMQKQMPAQIDLNLTDRIAQALKDEPTYTNTNEIVSPKTKSWPHGLRVLEGFSKKTITYATQFAIAASVATILIVNVSPKDESSNFDAPVLQTQPIFAGSTPVSLQTMPGKFDERRRLSKEEQAQQQEKINQYIYDYSFRERLYQQKYGMQP